jgi:hypothetical protein
MSVVVTERQVDNELKLRQGAARDHFYAFRALTRTQMLTNWWTKEISSELQWFYEDLKAGRREV